MRYANFVAVENYFSEVEVTILLFRVIARFMRATQFRCGDKIGLPGQAGNDERGWLLRLSPRGVAGEVPFRRI